MPKSWKTFAFAAGLMFAGLMFAGAAPAAADEGAALKGYYGAQNFLTRNTLVYTEKDGAEHSIYFGRFDNFDLYFPCQFESGAWSLSEDHILRLTYDTAQIKPKAFKLVRLEEGGKVASGISLTGAEDGEPRQAKLLEGNRLPVG
ncbi:MAG: hypothetical protein HOF70_17010 [Rhodospirillaceae bacterium]|jgi:hypothetical protein|nr:hypothetical protein [Rhodospirillaceae bacterium]MBT3886487.1 hypothetical protein [Rhodospirillaceae bacterium]MBT4116211.1 hypothetical protein [Rhodospirillaceae bacterium]MBT5180409.1 hypothetical protein [Rhodospirillaceae bacterium]MBT5838802.1 hypothetical protein [Rhodospirillaceae bacterium]